MPAGWRNANGPSPSRCGEISHFNQLTVAPPLQFFTAKGEHTMSVNSDSAIAQQTTKPSKALNLTIWGVQILTALAFLAAGGSKLSSAPPMVEMFEKIGFGQWFRYVTGSLEVAGAVLLLVPKTAAIGGWLLSAVMIGAIGTHLFMIGGNPIPPAVLLVLAITVAWNRSRW
jgi:putative oxidoreductase